MDKLPAFIEEVFRLEAAFQGHFRWAKHDCELHGVKLSRGSRMFLMWASGNRDERIWDQPDEIDLKRTNGKKHLTFGHGIQQRRSLISTMDHSDWMRSALEQADLAGQLGEVPVGAVIVRDGEIIGRGFNQPISGCDPTAHAEVQALRQAAQRLDNYRLSGATLYVTIEPCHMCAGALVHARVERLVFGAREPRAGAVISQNQLLEAPFLNHRVHWQEGVLVESCAGLLRDFFARKRLKSR